MKKILLLTLFLLFATISSSSAAFNPYDPNGSGTTTMADVLICYKQYLGIPMSVDYPLADVSGDGRVTMVDVLKIYKKYLGLSYLSAPTSVYASAGDSRVTISWTAVTDATSYNIYWSTTSGVTKITGTKITGATSPYSHTGRINGTPYYYVATAVNSSGESGASSQASATPTDIPSAGWVQTELNPRSGRSLYATDAEIFAATTDGVYATIDTGMPWFSKGLADRDVCDVIKSHQYILAGTIDGVYRSSDNGNAWLPTNSPSLYKGGGPHVFAKNSTYVFAIAWARGIFRSGDDGENWEQVYLGRDLPEYQDYAASANCICTVGETIVIDGAAPGTWHGRSNERAIYSSSDNGNTWVGSLGPPGYPDFRTDEELSVLYNDNGKLFASGVLGVYLSTDLGKSWSTQYLNSFDEHGAMTGVGQLRDIVSYHHYLTTGGAFIDYLIAAVNFNGIYISSDDGKSWTSFNEGLIPDWTFAALAIKPPYIWALRSTFGNAYRRPLP